MSVWGGGLHWKEKEPKDIHPTRNEKEIKARDIPPEETKIDTDWFKY